MKWNIKRDEFHGEWNGLRLNKRHWTLRIIIDIVTIRSGAGACETVFMGRSSLKTRLQ